VPLDARFSLIRRRHADAALGWVVSDPAVLSGPLDVMALGEFEPEVWIPARAGVGKWGVIGLAELAGMDVVHGPRRTVPVLVMHGDDDQIVPYADSGPLSAKLVQNGTLKTYHGFPHGMPTTQAATINADLLAWLQS
jgi:pimeloyl-ACP methyl ester carboxylesterase